VHDEVVLNLPVETAEARLAEATTIMETPPDWCKQLPLGAEGMLTNHYTK
jgi:hypothetical protein